MTKKKKEDNNEETIYFYILMVTYFSISFIPFTVIRIRIAIMLFLSVVIFLGIMGMFFRAKTVSIFANTQRKILEIEKEALQLKDQIKGGSISAEQALSKKRDLFDKCAENY